METERYCHTAVTFMHKGHPHAKRKEKKRKEKKRKEKKRKVGEQKILALNELSDDTDTKHLLKQQNLFLILIKLMLPFDQAHGGEPSRAHHCCSRATCRMKTTTHTRVVRVATPTTRLGNFGKGGAGVHHARRVEELDVPAEHTGCNGMELAHVRWCGE
jgi:hypothetical protein